MLKADLRNLRVRVRMEWFSAGSIMAGTIQSGVNSVSSELEVESDDPPELIAALVQNAKAGCYAETALAQPVEIASTVLLNGSALDYRAFPKRPPSR